MISRENLVVVVCVVAALPLAYGVDSLTGSYPAGLATLFVVGIGLPSLFNRVLSE
jgi:hypothetical protein